ncbi:MAG: hypothetical protein KDB68_12610 [Planctomycetes bacterium]|nr:hypothetical protein [Planctomycetota bacterium]
MRNAAVASICFASVIAVIAAFHTSAGAQRVPGGGRFPGGGKIPGGGLPAQGSEGDWYNLGPIGGKATMEKNTLIVQKVFDDAPGAKGGLMVGDVITGAPKSFKKDAYHELGEAIEAAEAQRKKKSAVVELNIERDGKAKQLEIDVPFYGKDAKDFPGGKMREAIVDDALAYLAKQQQSDGGWECHLSGENGRVVMTSLCGMAMLAAGNSASKGTYKSNVKRAAEFVSANVGKESEFGRMGGSGANWNQTNWGLGYGGMFLAEVQNASPVKGVDDKLEWIAETILANMEATGGFAHGPGGPNALNYLELEIVSNYCVAALGGAMANGVDVDAKKVEKALDYIQQCGGGKGGVGYSTRQGQVGWGDPGRTGGAIMAFGAVGRDDHSYYKSMVGYLQGNLHEIIEGHVSPTMHHLSAAAACYREGSKAWDRYWEAQRHECTMLRNPDGTFTARPTKESAQMGRNNDLDLGTDWNTAHWTIILCLEKDNLPVWFGKKGKPKNADKEEDKKDDKDPVTGKEDKQDKEKKKPEKEEPDMDEILE